jgi:4-amino-4-deoxy-L-arabinose transferase-like glycosyltransferase
LATLAVGATAGLAGLLFDRRAALVAAWIAALYPEAIALGAFVLSEAPFVPLMLVHLILWTCAWRAPTRPAAIGWAASGGLAAALATLMRPSWLLFVPFAGVIGLVVGGEFRKHALVTGIMLLTLALGMSPWWVRNYRLAGRFVPTTLQVGASLYDGLNPAATGASDMRFVPRFIAEQRAADTRNPAPAGLFEDRLDRGLRDAALAWARANPQRVLELAATKFARMWSPLPNAGEFQSLWLRVALAATYTPVLALALVGAWRYFGRGWPVWLCLLPACYFTALHVIFVSSIRYRQPAMLPLIVLAAAVLAHWRTKRIPP